MTSFSERKANLQYTKTLQLWVADDILDRLVWRQVQKKNDQADAQKWTKHKKIFLSK